MWNKFEIYSIKKTVLFRKGRAFYATLYQEVFFGNSGGGSLTDTLGKLAHLLSRNKCKVRPSQIWTDINRHLYPNPLMDHFHPASPLITLVHINGMPVMAPQEMLPTYLKWSLKYICQWSEIKEASLIRGDLENKIFWFNNILLYELSVFCL